MKARLAVLCALLASFAFAQKDWTTYTTRDDGLTIAFPKDWTAFTGKDIDFDQRFAEFKRRNPALAQYVPGGVTDKQLLLLVDTGRIKNGFADNFNIFKGPAGDWTTESFGDIVPQMEEAYGKTLIGKMEHKIVDLPAGKALIYWCTLDLGKAEGKEPMEMFAAIILKRPSVYICGFGTKAGQGKERHELWESILKTAKFK